MKRVGIVFGVVFLIAISLVKTDAVGSTYASGQLVVLPRDANVVASLHASGYTTISTISGTGYRLMGIRPGISTEAALAELSNRGDVVSTEFNYVGKALITPNDPVFPTQYHLAITRCTDAWDITQGSTSDTIAIVDSGGDTKHLDLASRVVFAPGIDILDGDSDPSEPITGTGHATNVAGVAAAITNNANDGAGVDWNARILFVRVLTADNSVNNVDMSKGILKAIEHKASVINLSLGFNNNFTLDLSEYALLAARNAGIIVVAAAGNSGGDATHTVQYPASSFHAIAVGATDNADSPASFSSYGAPPSLTGVDVAAPGKAIITTTAGFGTASVDGTSFSSPFVAGTASLLKSIRREYTPANFLTLLTGTAKDILTTGFDEVTGAGRIDVLNLLRTAQNNAVFPFANDSNAFRIDLFNGTLGDVRTATASIASGRQGRSGLAISGDNVFVGYDSSVNRDTGSIEFYIRFDSAQSSETRYVLTQHGSAAKPKGSLDLIFTSDSKLQFSLQDSGVITSQTVLRPGQWYHVGLTYGAKGMILLVNGESEASMLVIGGPSPADTIYIGAPAAFGGAKSARCQVDALRFSKTQRIIFASALATKIWSLSSRAIDNVNVSWTALKNDTTSVKINIYADKDSIGFDGTLLASDLDNVGQAFVSVAPLASAGNPFFIYIEAYDVSFPSERALVYSDTPFQAFSPLAGLLSSTTSAAENVCLLSKVSAPIPLHLLREVRDWMLETACGKLMVEMYYALG